jgi:hypothetical protein
VGATRANFARPGQETRIFYEFAGAHVIWMSILTMGSQNNARSCFSDELNNRQAMCRIGSNLAVWQANQGSCTEAKSIRSFLFFTPTSLGSTPAGHLTGAQIGNGHAQPAVRGQY